MPGKTSFTTFTVKKECPSLRPVHQWSDHSTVSKPARIHLNDQGKLRASVVEVGHDESTVLPNKDGANGKAKGVLTKKVLRKLLPFAGLSVGLASLGLHIADFVEALNGLGC